MRPTTVVRATVLAVAAIQLGGCSSFLGIKFARHAAPEEARPESAQPDSTLASAPATELGRQQLADGRTGLAVESFQRALGAGEPVAPALNGMGVAFARLGRYDLAQRFFEQAMAADPSDARYAENMTRLMRSPVLSMRRDADIAAKAQAQLAANTERQPVQAAKAPGQIQRLSRAEVRIVTASPAGQASAKAATTGFKPLIRVAFADKEADAAKGFVRIELPQPASAKPGDSSPNATKPAGAR